MSKVTPEWIEERKAALPGEMMALVQRQPGMPKTYYIYLKVAEGGLRGLSDDKYEAMQKLLREGALVYGVSRGKMRGFKGLYPEGHPERMSAWAEQERPASDLELEDGLVRLVEQDPGRGQTHYCRLPLVEGGLRGSQERKERAMSRLLEQGRLRLVELPSRVGRLTHAVCLPEPELASAAA